MGVGRRLEACWRGHGQMCDHNMTALATCRVRLGGKHSLLERKTWLSFHDPASSEASVLHHLLHPAFTLADLGLSPRPLPLQGACRPPTRASFRCGTYTVIRESATGRSEDAPSTPKTRGPTCEYGVAVDSVMRRGRGVEPYLHRQAPCTWMHLRCRYDQRPMGANAP